jgi:starch synthase (maltosyl-transferring)
MEPEGQKRVAIEQVWPEIDGGRFAIKRTVGQKVIVQADIFADGHDLLAAVLLYRRRQDAQWTEVAMTPLGNDRWQGEFTVTELGEYLYTLQAWVDHFETWRRDLAARLEAEQEVGAELLAGAEMIAGESAQATGSDRKLLAATAASLRRSDGGANERAMLALDERLRELMRRYAARRYAVTYPRELAVTVDRELAGFGAWYEMFVRSCASKPGRHGTFRDCEARLPYIANMNFDVLYLAPIHPIGARHRKGPNNRQHSDPDDPGSPWAIGSATGGHKAVHPDLGTLKDFRRLLRKAAEYGIEIAIDLAFQVSADHPYAKAHPEWFRRRPDGSVRYAENPPKKYEDIYPFDFESERWRELWEELRSVVIFWIEQGVRIFRVDNPHTKPFEFWEWLIRDVRRRYPDLIFLSEAFTRPKVMHQLAKLGFSQSYTYFAWRNTKWEIADYLSELFHGPGREYLRPSLWPNTPDILPEYLQFGGRPAFITRLCLAATLSGNYGIYGPAFELCEATAREPGSEEYLDSEKYQLRHWNLERPDSLAELIGRVNRIRKENPALRSDWSLRFHPVDNDQLICFSKHTDDFDNLIVVAANLDSYHTQSGWVELPLEEWRIDPQHPYQMHDLVTEARYLWQGQRGYLELNPAVMPVHIFRLRRHVRSEQQFEYYL